MRYFNTKTAVFLSRPNRFIAMVNMDGAVERVHVKNTGRCKELLILGAVVVLSEGANPGRSTRYDLIAVYSRGQLVNIDSQAPNKAAAEHIQTLYPGAVNIKPEYSHGDSRLDFYFEHEDRPVYMEVKGVTLWDGATALFPDAPTERGVKHIRNLIKCREDGAETCIFFVLQMTGIRRLIPNDKTHKAFGDTLRDAAKAGVRICAADCRVTPDEMVICRPVAVEPYGSISLGEET